MRDRGLRQTKVTGYRKRVQKDRQTGYRQTVDRVQARGCRHTRQTWQTGCSVSLVQAEMTDRHERAEIDRNDEQGTQTDITVRIQAWQRGYRQTWRIGYSRKWRTESKTGITDMADGVQTGMTYMTERVQTGMTDSVVSFIWKEEGTGQTWRTEYRQEWRAGYRRDDTHGSNLEYVNNN